ncbi:hypothetical protein ACIFQM_11095 [Paenibacillus sp. NRS-1782]|uniref:hypothetical protein n=1 Tax=unclassified Paenibacillus TaxID=185978 RepID=UPI003D2AC75A
MGIPAFSPDLIRNVALDVLAKRSEGIKQADLFRATESELMHHYIIPEHSIKNALWDLGDRFPKYVIKRKPSYREVWLFPADDLLRVAPITEILELPPTISDWEEAERDHKQSQLIDYNISGLNNKTIEIARFIEFSGIEENIRVLQQEGIDHMSPDEKETFFKLKLTLGLLKEVRNEVAHQRKLR